MEALRYLPWLSTEGWIVTNTTPFVNIGNYHPRPRPLDRALRSLPRVIAIDVDTIAKEAASPRAANIVLLGAAAPLLDLEAAKLEQGIRDIFARKGDAVVESNLAAFRAGYEYARKSMQR